MKDNLSDGKKIYFIINAVALGILLYLALLPLLTPLLSSIFPEIWRCQYWGITGKPCPFCFITRDFSQVLNGNWQFSNPLTPAALIVLLVEIPARALILSFYSRLKRLSAFVIADSIIHSLLATALVSYCILFFVG